MTTSDDTVLRLVRHGQSTWNLAGRVQGQSQDAGGLTPAGRAEAEAAARLLAERHPLARHIVASDLPRAHETAEIIAGRLGLPVRHDPELREQHLGRLEGLLFREPGVQEAVDALWRHPGRQPPGGESVAAMYARVRGALRRHAAAHPGSGLVVVTHGGPVRVALTTADPERGEAVDRTAVANASVSTLNVPAADR